MPILFPTSPTVGQVFTEGGRSWVWSGATWDAPTATNTLLAPYGSTLVASQNFTSQPAVAFDNIFTSAFDYYQIVASFIGSQESNMILRLRQATVDLVGSSYQRNEITLSITTQANNSTTTDSGWRFGVMRTGQNAFVSGMVANPARSGQSKNMNYHGSDFFASNPTMEIGQGLHSTTQVYDGIKLLPTAGTFSGSIRIYGLRN
jgi:hypothetical protein